MASQTDNDPRDTEQDRAPRQGIDARTRPAPTASEAESADAAPIRSFDRLPATTAVVAGLQGGALVAYGALIGAIGLIGGVTGPSDVASPIGVVVETATFMALGAGLLLVGLGRLRRSEWSTTPFVLAQLLALTVGVPLLRAPDSVGTVIGVAVFASAVIGLGALLAQRFTRGA